TVPQNEIKAETESAQRHSLQESIARIHDASQAPPLAPAEYRLLFEIMATELNENGLSGGQTIRNIGARASENGFEIKQDDIQFILDVVSEADPWFEQGASPALFAGRFRNYVLSQCRKLGLQLSSDEIDLIDAWFVGTLQIPTTSSSAVPSRPVDPPFAQSEPSSTDNMRETAEAEVQFQSTWDAEQSESQYARVAGGHPVAGPTSPMTSDRTSASISSQAGRDISQFPRIVRSRMRG
ncbi:MAG: NYN domain-containing protein, partial [Methyloligellaceae bacterium]